MPACTPLRPDQTGSHAARAQVNSPKPGFIDGFMELVARSYEEVVHYSQHPLGCSTAEAIALSNETPH